MFKIRQYAASVLTRATGRGRGGIWAHGGSEMHSVFGASGAGRRQDVLPAPVTQLLLNGGTRVSCQNEMMDDAMYIKPDI